MNKKIFFPWLILVAAALACQTTDSLSYYLSPPTEEPTRTRVPTRASVAPVTQPTAPVAIIATPTPVEITGTVLNNANIRAAPTSTAAIAARASKGDQLKILARNPSNEWYLVRLPNNPNAYGWITIALVQAPGGEQLPVFQPGGPPPYPRP